MKASSTFLAVGIQVKSDIVATVLAQFMLGGKVHVETLMDIGPNKPDVFFFQRPRLVEEGQSYGVVVKFLEEVTIAKDSKIIVSLLEADLTQAIRDVEHKQKVRLAPSAKRRVLQNAYQVIFNLGWDSKEAVENAVSIEPRSSDGLIA